MASPWWLTIQIMAATKTSDTFNALAKKFDKTVESALLALDALSTAYLNRKATLKSNALMVGYLVGIFQKRLTRLWGRSSCCHRASINQLGSDTRRAGDDGFIIAR